VKKCSLNEESTKLGMVVHLGVLSSISYGSTLKNQYGRHFQNGRHKYTFLLAFLDNTYNINARISKVYTVDA
jgi:hypothetical protein